MPFCFNQTVKTNRKKNEKKMEMGLQGELSLSVKADFRYFKFLWGKFKTDKRGSNGTCLQTVRGGKTFLRLNGTPASRRKKRLIPRCTGN
jgi:hypothetical protein